MSPADNQDIAQAVQVTCCVAGGGPAGMMLGFLLARAGIETLVLEKHKDFLRDFRGDTVHPSTLDVIAELGLLDDFLKLPHQEVREIGGKIGDVFVRVGDFAHTPTRCHFIAFMPQWDFLNFLAEHGRRYPAFHLRMEAEVSDLIEENGAIVGVKVKTPQGPLMVRASLVVGADGRHSTVRERGKLRVKDLGAPIDVFWTRLSKKQGDPMQVLGYFNFGRVLVMLDRGDYWQCGFVIRKGQAEAMRAQGLPAFREDIAKLAPFMRDRVEELRDWNQVSLLTVLVDRLEQWWRPGLLCIGDSAHAMSPVGGVGINLAIQDAVAAANILARPLREGTLAVRDLAQVQDRRMFPTRVTQGMQIVVQERVLSRVLGDSKAISPPLAVRMFNWVPWLRRIPARVIGVGVRPEHVETPENASRAAPRIEESDRMRAS
ncbi:MAG TPA: FAD-dependent oxidoreductase [Terriglobales bacterium]|nr:FAD-dependent oxidoreductase [Terriglobales bacterium]